MPPKPQTSTKRQPWGSTVSGDSEGIRKSQANTGYVWPPNTNTVLARSRPETPAENWPGATAEAEDANEEGPPQYSGPSPVNPQLILAPSHDELNRLDRWADILQRVAKTPVAPGHKFGKTTVKGDGFALLGNAHDGQIFGSQLLSRSHVFDDNVVEDRGWLIAGDVMGSNLLELYKSKPSSHSNTTRSRADSNEADQNVGSDEILAGGYRNMIEMVAHLFCLDHELHQNHIKARKQFGVRVFRQYHDQLLKYYFRDLIKAVENDSQLAALRSLNAKSNRSLISSLIIEDSIVMDKDNTDAARESQVDALLETLPGSSIGHVREDDDLPDTSSGSEVEQVDEAPPSLSPEFLVKERPYARMKSNMQKLLQPPQSFAEAVQSRSELLVVRFLKDHGIDSSALGDRAFRRVQDLRTQGASYTKIAETVISEQEELLPPETLSPIPEGESTVANTFSIATSMLYNSLPRDRNSLTKDGKQQGLSADWKAISNVETTTKSKTSNGITKRVHVVSFKCACGTRITDEYIELRPGGIAKLESALLSQKLGERHSIWQRCYEALKATLALKLSNRPVGVQGSGGSTSTGTFTYNSATNNPAPNNALSTGASPHNSNTPTTNTNNGQTSSSTSNTPLANPPYLLLSFPKHFIVSKLHPEELPTNKIRTDRELFDHLRTIHTKQRNLSTLTLGLKTVTKISFATFDIDLNNYIDLKNPHLAGCDPTTAKCCVLPPSNLTQSPNPDYKYEPATPDHCPPRGPNYMAHYFQHPEELHDQQDFILNQIPKYMRGRPAAATNAPTRGWGLHFEEGINYWPLVAATLVPSLIFGILWTVIKGDIQGGFGVAAYWLAFEMIPITYIFSPAYEGK